jgi:hypothetical protein
MALPSKPKFSDFKKVTTIQGTHEVVGLNPSEPNAGDRNARFQLSDLRSFLMTGVPTSPGRWVSQPSVTVTPNGDGTATIAVTAGTATFNGVTVEYNAASYPSVSLPGQGLMRQDAVAALESGSFSYVTGTASQNPATPSLPSGSLLANYILLDSTGGQIEEPVAYEPAFSKNTAFNKNFGTGAGTVAEGNHTHSDGLQKTEPAGVTLLFDGTTRYLDASTGSLTVGFDDGTNNRGETSYYKGTGYYQINPWTEANNGTVWAYGGLNTEQYISGANPYSTASASYYAGKSATGGFAKGDLSGYGYSEGGATNWVMKTEALAATGGNRYKASYDMGSTAFDSASRHIWKLEHQVGTTPQSAVTMELRLDGLYLNNVKVGETDYSGVYEPAFTKNTAFNKNFGTTAGTVAQGNDSRLTDARTPLAHNHAGEAITSGTVADARLSSNVALKAVNNLFPVVQTFSAGILSNSIANITSANNALLSLLTTGVEAVTAVSSNVALKIRNTVTSATGNLTEWVTGTVTVAKVTSTGIGDFAGFRKAGNVAFVDDITNVAPALLQGVGDIPPTEVTKLQDPANWTNGDYTGTPLVNCNQGTGISLTINSVKYRVVFDTDNVPTRLTRG